jgi:hypothetical protein
MYKFEQCGRVITKADIEHVKLIVRDFRGLPRSEIAHTICEHWGWVTASGSNKVQACLKVLERLEDLGELSLPAKRERPVIKPVKPIWTERTKFGNEIVRDLKGLGPVGLSMVTDAADKALWNEYVDRYHYLGYKKPFGFRVRYFIESEQGRLGCVLFAGAAKSIGVRDSWIGWSERRRLTNLPWVINQSRYLIFPWVRVRYLASHVLAMAVKRVCLDWEDRWGYRPVLLESFVGDGYQGTCYKAAGFQYLGMTTGQGLVRRGKSYTTHPRKIFVKPLARDFRFLLCSEQLKGRERQ